MSFASIEYLAFLVAAAAFYRLASPRFRPLCLLLLSCLFYASADARGLELLASAVLIAYAMALAIQRAVTAAVRLALTTAAVLLLTVLLLLFKVLPGEYRPFSWLVPLGISYYTFKLLAYVIDVYWQKRQPERNVISLACFAAFFPQIVAGPIQRSEDFLPQLANPRPVSLSLLSRGFGRIAFGLFKKLAVADPLGMAVNTVYRAPWNFHAAPLLVAFYLFPLQLYADFSGLTDIAIGSGLLLGIETPENFARPFSATSISDYWRRWHMSLTNWLADYVFLPLRMSLRSLGAAGLVLAITVNMIGIGLWHGFAWGFLVFGLLHAAFLSIDALSVRSRNSFLKKHPRLGAPLSFAGWFFTFHAVALAMVFFRAQTVTDALWLLAHMWSLSGVGAFAEKVGAVPLVRGLAGYACFELIDAARQTRPDFGRLTTVQPALRWSAYGACAGVALIGLLLLMAQTAANTTFLYAIF